MISKRKFLLLFLLSLIIFVNADNDLTRGLRLIVKDKSGIPNEIKVYDRMFGLVIGINEYADPQINILNNCVNDAKGVKKTLEKYYQFEKIEELYDKAATRDGILAKLRQMQRDYKITANNALFVFIASHGITFNDIGYIIPYDGSVKEEKQYKNISMTQLKEQIGEGIIKAKHIFYVIDACYSGSILTRASVSQRPKDDDYLYLLELTKERARFALTAGDKGQKVLDGGKNGHSVFTGRFIEALEEVNEYITASKLSSNIAKRVFSDAKDRGHIQNPQYGWLSGMGDFVFLKRESNSVAKIEMELSKIEKEIEDLKRIQAKMRLSQKRALRTFGIAFSP